MTEDVETYPEGHFVGMWMGIGMAIFSMMGVPLSIITDNYGFIGIGPAIGVAFGLSIGQAIENKKKEQGLIRPLTDAEKKNKQNLVYAAVGVLAIGVLVFVLLYFL